MIAATCGPLLFLIAQLLPLAEATRLGKLVGARETAKSETDSTSTSGHSRVRSQTTRGLRRR